ncbi:cytidine deaminase [Salinimonas sediminis]|uniref:Cytidine deaminase n=1 Tax=Salinimonas sediminis TaxID=2303538 RepID=A0A346NLP9_9ALTE|nr:cytidine deaminase [Salinimonas sediminis]AXR06456.1 cytidine deaminase [Salinimonas sediminis]
MDSKKLQQLIDLAYAAQANAHAPYSGFKVGAAVLSKHATTHAGCNVENAAYPLGQCAEATAIGNMICAGAEEIDAIVIASPNNEFCYPCGGCRQKIAEFAADSAQVIMVTKQGERNVLTMADLLPYAFRSADLASPQ